MRLVHDRFAPSLGFHDSEWHRFLVLPFGLCLVWRRSDA